MNAVHTQCLICGGAELSHLNKFVRTSLLKCSSCGFVFCEKIPTAKELTDYYSNYGLNQYLSPITVKRYHEWLDEFEQYRNTGNILDIGCASGLFLQEAKKRGWNVHGSEYGDDQVRFCREKGIIMHQGPLNQSAFPDIQFDVITSIEVIEHINNPNEEMGYISGLLRSGGLFFATTPNFNALSRYMLGDEYNIISWPEHLSYYTPATYHRLMQKHGFRKFRLTTTGISITRFNQSTGRKKQAVVSEGSDDEALRRKIESRFWLKWMKSFLNFVLNITGTGYSLKGWYIKK